MTCLKSPCALAFALLVCGCNYARGYIDNYAFPTAYENAHLIGMEFPKQVTRGVPFKVTVWAYQPRLTSRFDATVDFSTFKGIFIRGSLLITGQSKYTPPRFGEAVPTINQEPYIASTSITINPSVPSGTYMVSIPDGYYYKLPTPIVAITSYDGRNPATETALPEDAHKYFPLFYPAFGGTADIEQGRLDFFVNALPSSWATPSTTTGFEFPTIHASASGSIIWPIHFVSNAGDRPINIY